MKINRRVFLSGLATTAFASRCHAATEPDLMFGVVSDVHLRNPGDEDTLIATFTYFRDRGADGVVIAGDIADTGRREQLDRCGACWNKVFPGNRGLGGKHVEKLFVYGNHDVAAWQWGADKKKQEDPVYRQACITPDVQAAAWEHTFGEKYEPIWLKTVKGYRFVGLHWPAMHETQAFITAHAAELKGAKPFFFIQHAHPANTCMGTWAWGRDGRATQALSPFANAVAFSGHSHYTLTDERTVWQGAFTSLNTSSLRYTSGDYSLRENFGRNDGGYLGEKRKHTLGSLNTGTGRQGMLVSVYGSELEIERRDFYRGKSLGPNWRISVPPAAGMSFADRAAKRVAPQFAAGTQLKTEVTADKVILKFPSAKTVENCRVYEYELTATLVEDDVDLIQAQRRMMAPDFYLPDGDPISAKAVEFIFARSELPCTGHYVFSVRPLECFGKKGAAIAAPAIL